MPVAVGIGHILNQPLRQAVVENRDKHKHLDRDFGDLCIRHLAGTVAVHVFQVQESVQEAHALGRILQELTDSPTGLWRFSQSWCIIAVTAQPRLLGDRISRQRELFSLDRKKPKFFSFSKSIFAQAVNLWERLDDPKQTEDFLALRYWLNDNIDFPGEVYCKSSKDCYQDNLLVQNRMQIDAKIVDLGRITANLLTVTAAQDHICPPPSAAVLNDLVSSQDKQVLTLPGGHIGIVAGSGASQGLWVKLGDWLAQRSGR